MGIYGLKIPIWFTVAWGWSKVGTYIFQSGSESISDSDSVSQSVSQYVISNVINHINNQKWLTVAIWLTWTIMDYHGLSWTVMD